MNFVKSLIPYVAIVLVVLLIRTFIITPIFVQGTSMYPTLNDKQVLILKKFDKSIKRFDIVVFNYKGDRLIKRVIGLPGEHVEYKDSKLYINDELVEEKMINVSTANFKLEDIGYKVIPEGYYFVVGDNRGVSKDSRIIGLIPKKIILGTTDLSIFPFNKIGFVK